MKKKKKIKCISFHARETGNKVGKGAMVVSGCLFRGRGEGRGGQGRAGEEGQAFFFIKIFLFFLLFHINV